MNTTERFHYIDNLRSIALLFGIVFHAALAYGPYFSTMWFSADPSNHVLFNYLAIWTHLFRMPLFFVIAGFCAALLISKRGPNAFMTDRLKRLLIPFIIFLPLTLICVVHAISWSSSFLDTLPLLFTVFKSVDEPVITTMHLWFIWNLSQFCLLLWLISHYQKLYQVLLSLSVKPLFLCMILPIIITFAMSSQAVPFPPPDKIMPMGWSFGFYGVLFIVGAGLFHHHKKIIHTRRCLGGLFLLAVFSLLAYFALLPPAPTLEKMIEAARLGAFVPEHFNPWAVIVQTVAILSWTASVFLAGYLWLNKQNATSRYLSDASYWIYLSHVPILLYIQLPLINTDLSVFLKFIISVCATLGIGLISYHYLVRGTVIGLLLNGKRTAHATNQYVVNQNTN